ncbi:MAG: head GIN domain-containing protein [Ferruginibacter sp.]
METTKIKIIPFIIACTLFLLGCNYKKGSGNIVSEKRQTTSFKSVKVSGDFEVMIKKGDNEEVIIEADDNLVNNIETKVVKGQLRIRTKDDNLRNSHFKATVTAPYINDIRASASACVTSNSLDSPDAIELHASSASIITAVVNAPVVTGVSSSGAELVLSGRTKNFKGSVSSGADIKAKNLLSETTIIKASSGGYARVHASILLNASASSGAEIIYTGGANVVQNASSGGEITKSN